MTPPSTPASTTAVYAMYTGARRGAFGWPIAGSADIQPETKGRLARRWHNRRVAMREWTVASGLIERDGELLLVRNVRRNGVEDWSTPGGVVDAEDLSLLAALTREVEEETGLVVSEWVGPVYEVVAE